MNRRERLLASLRGQPVDRVPVSFYEIGGFAVNPDDADPFNIYNDPSWRPLLQLAEEQTDLIRMRHPAVTLAHPDLHKRFSRSESTDTPDLRIHRQTLTVAGRTLTSTSQRSRDIDTWWTTEHLLKDVADVEAYLQLPDELFHASVDTSPLAREERTLGDRGIIMLDTADPICHVAGLMDLAWFLELALTVPELTHRLLEQASRWILPRVEAAARQFPGHLWRIYGPEYATPPYLPPALFSEYVVRYTTPLIDVIQRNGGFARIHCHGRLHDVLPLIASMHPDALDPIEPPPQGDVSLAYVRQTYGRDLTLFGNIEAAAIETLPPDRFDQLVAQSLADAASAPGRGFVLLPSACPYGRTITPQIIANYQTLIRRAEKG